jgi:zinc transport system substrate-binding protein
MSRLGAVLLAAALSLAAPLAEAADPPRVAVTIKPVHALAAALMEGSGASPELVYQGASSPHTAALRPSEVERVIDADVLFMIGDGYERLMERAVGQRPKSAVTVALADAPGVTTMPFREDAAFEAHTHEGEAGHDHDHDHDKKAEAGHDHDHDHGAGVDPHIWLDPENARAIARVMADTLAKADPERAGLYRQNLAAVETGLDTLDRELAAILAPVKGKRFIVFHDAYHYLEARYGVTAAGSIVLNPEATPGADRLKQVRDRIASLGATCVFAEPQFEIGYVTTVIEGTAARPGTLDPLGASVDPGPAAYRAVMLDLARNMAGCLSGQS